MSYPWFVFICICARAVLTGSLLDDSIRCWYAVGGTRHCFMCLLRARCFMSPSHWVIYIIFMYSAWTLMWLAGWDDSERLLSRAGRYSYAFYSDSNDDDHYDHLMCLLIYDMYMYIYALCQDCNLVTISKFAWPLTIGSCSDLLTFICIYHMHLLDQAEGFCSNMLHVLYYPYWLSEGRYAFTS